MAADGQTDVTWMQWALGLLAAAWAGGMLFLHGRVEKVRSHDEKGRKALWDRVNKNDDDTSRNFLEAEKRYATNDDLDKLGARLERTIVESERRVMDAIVNRPPVRSP